MLPRHSSDVESNDTVHAIFTSSGGLDFRRDVFLHPRIAYRVAGKRPWVHDRSVDGRMTLQPRVCHTNFGRDLRSHIVKLSISSSFLTPPARMCSVVTNSFLDGVRVLPAWLEQLHGSEKTEKPGSATSCMRAEVRPCRSGSLQALFFFVWALRVVTALTSFAFATVFCGAKRTRAGTARAPSSRPTQRSQPSSFYIDTASKQESSQKDVGWNAIGIQQHENSGVKGKGTSHKYATSQTTQSEPPRLPYLPFTYSNAAYQPVPTLHQEYHH